MSDDEDARPARRLARAALRDFGFNQARLVQLASRHNDVFRVTVPGGERYVLRLQNDLMSDAQAATQLLWLDALSQQTSVRVPRPVKTMDGRIFAHVGGGRR